MKTVFIMSKRLQKTIFTPQNIDEISQFGESIYFNGEDNPTPSDAGKLIAGADAAITSWGAPRLCEEILAEAPDLKLVLHAAGSVKGIVSPDLWKRGVRVANSADPLGKGVAETALALTITSLKNIWRLSAGCRRGEWNEGYGKIREVYGICIGVIGAGHAGRHYIRLMRQFDVDVLLYDPTLSEEQAVQLGAKKVDLDILLKNADVVSIHAPSVPATDKMLNSQTLKLMKDGAILINTARGSIVDEPALVEELNRNRIFACIDVTDPEPCALSHPFRTLPNVILTPHIAGAVNNGLYRIGAHICNELRLFSENGTLTGEIKEKDLTLIG